MVFESVPKTSSLADRPILILKILLHKLGTRHLTRDKLLMNAVFFGHIM